MSVSQICIRDVDLADPDEPVQVAAARLRDRCVGSLVVCDNNGHPIGVLTDRDIAIRVVAECLDPNDTLVSDVMSVAPTCIDESTSVEIALRTMRQGPHRRLAVVNARRELVGVVSLDDILSLLADDFREIGGLLRSEGPASLLSAGR